MWKKGEGEDGKQKGTECKNKWKEMTEGEDGEKRGSDKGGKEERASERGKRGKKKGGFRLPGGSLWGPALLDAALT